MCNLALRAGEPTEIQIRSVTVRLVASAQALHDQTGQAEMQNNAPPALGMVRARLTGLSSLSALLVARHTTSRWP